MRGSGTFRATLALATSILASSGGGGVAHAQEPGELEYVDRRDPYDIDPLTDTSIISLSLAFGAFSEIVLSSGEIIPQQPQDPSHLPFFDRATIYRADPWAGPISTYAVMATMAWGVIDPIATGFRDGADPAVDLGVLYVETVSLAWAAANTAKLIVRRPRPRAYQEQRRLVELYGKDKAPNISETDFGMSFFSGHTAMAAALSSTATYHAFVRDPDAPRPWLTLGAGTALTTLVAIERVRSGAHFPSDVVAAAFAGVGIGLLVPHLHRETRAVTTGGTGVAATPLESGPRFQFGGQF